MGNGFKESRCLSNIFAQFLWICVVLFWLCFFWPPCLIFSVDNLLFGQGLCKIPLDFEVLNNCFSYFIGWSSIFLCPLHYRKIKVQYLLFNSEDQINFEDVSTNPCRHILISHYFQSKIGCQTRY